MKVKVLLFIAAAGYLAALISSCQSESELEYQRYYSSGLLAYQNNCQNCHGNNGEGLGALIPPLTDSHYLKTSKNKLACFIKYGLKNAITINGKTYTGTMPPQDALTPIEIAQVLTYVTNSFGNKAGLIDGGKVNVDLGKCE